MQDVSIADLQMEFYEKDSSAGAVILFDICNIDLDLIHDDFVLKQTRIIRIKFFDESEFDWANISIPFYFDKTGSQESVKIKKAITYNAVNGKIEKKTLNKKDYIEEPSAEYYRQIKFAMSNVKAGSIIEYEYEIQSPFKTPRTWHFQHSIPTLHSELKAELTNFWHYNTLLKGYENAVFDTSYVIENVGTCTWRSTEGIANAAIARYEYHKAVSHIIFKNIPALHFEKYMQCTEDYVTKVDFQLVKYEIPKIVNETILKTWEEVASDYYDLFELDKKVKVPNDLKSRLVDSELSPEEKTKIILSYVKDKYTWNGKDSRKPSQSSKELMESKSGNSADINLYLIRLLRQNELNAYPVILSTTDNGRLHYKTPFIKQFNYILPIVADQKGVFFCDATLNCAPYYLVPQKCLNGHGFLIDKQQPQFVELIDISQTSSKYVTTCSFNQTIDSVSINTRLEAFGYDALQLRKLILKGDNDAVIKKVFPNEENVNFEYKGNIKEEDPNKPLVLNFKMNKEVLKIKNKVYFNPFICNVIDKNPFKSIERNYPIDFRNKEFTRQLISVSLPQGYKLNSAPESNLSTTNQNSIQYNLKVQSNPYAVQALSEFRINNPLVNSEAYAELKELYNQMIKDQSEYFVISKQD